MKTLEVNDREAGLLRTMLESYLSDLRMEIADTDKLEYREMLKERERLLKRLLTDLNGQPYYTETRL